MLKLLNKEFKLFLIKPTLLFYLLAATMVIPAYPSIVAAFFAFLIIQICYQTAQSNRDMEFTAMLPVSRNQIVASKMVFTMLIQLLYLVTCIPFAIISSLLLNPEGNIVGMDKNIAFFGYALVASAVFNILFFPLFFKNTQKLGVPIVFALAGYFIFSVIFELIVGLVPNINAVLDTLNPAMIPAQAIFFVCCIIIYCLIMLVAYKVSAKTFQKMVI